MMTVHVLHAGDGYTYLTRQVASADVRRQRGDSLADYYVHDGNPPGRWVGEGLATLGVDGTVTEAQMKALFGEGRHPEADLIERAAVVDGANVEEAMSQTRLGRRFPQFKARNDTEFPVELERAHLRFRAEHGRDADAGAERDALRREAAGAVLAGRGKVSTPAAVARYLAQLGNETRQPVAGYDLVFTPAKSISVLWGLGDERVAEQVGRAHEVAWRATMQWLESEAALTRVGAGGVAQVDTRGLIATAFDHIDSRAGDPNLHTHVAVSNKVQGVDGKWRALDGRVMHALGVAASERYNTLIESELVARLGVRFVDVETARGRQPVREIDGIDASLRSAFSTRRAAIEDRFNDLVASYRSRHGHEPGKAEQYKLAQQATLESRQAKEEGVALSTRRAQWQARAAQVLGTADVTAHVQRALRRDVEQPRSGEPNIAELADQVIDNLSRTRSTWGISNIQAEAQRAVRVHADSLDVGVLTALADLVVQAALDRSLSLSAPDQNPVPAALQRSDGESIYRSHAAERFTAVSVLEAENRIVEAALRTQGPAIRSDVVAAVLASDGAHLNAGQAQLARAFASSGRLVCAGIGPAGAGKTTAMSAFARAVTAGGGRVLGLAPSAAAAAVLGEELAIGADTIAKLLHAHAVAERDGTPVPERLRIDAGTFVLVDEAGMASTPDLDRIVALAARNGAAVRLIGDPAQLQAVGAGGVLRLLEEQVGAAQLDEVHRFVDEREAAASLRLRDGHRDALDFYIDAGRTTGGTREALTEQMYATWLGEVRDGVDSIMIAATNEDVQSLSARARLDRVTAGEVERGGAELHDGSRAGVGDIVVTRRNARALAVERGTDYVKNGDLWTVVERSDDGALRLRHRQHHGFVTVPAEYVAEHVELGYAATVHRAQGMTVDRGHYLVVSGATREHLYTGVTRGRQSNHLYVATDELLDPDLHRQPTGSRAVQNALEDVLARAEVAPSATSALNEAYDVDASLAALVPAYEDAWARFLDPDRDARMAAHVHAALDGELADAVLADPAWPALRDVLARHDAHGADVVSRLQRSYAVREIDTAASVAQVLTWRMGEPTGDVHYARLPAWITPAPRDLAPAAPAADVVAAAPTEVPSAEPAGAARVYAANEAAWRWWAQQASADASWVPQHLSERRLQDVEAGYAPAAWTATADALRAQGFSDEELTAAGLVTMSRRGQLIDRFRDRLVIPVRDQHDRIVAFTARANPAEVRDDVPKYLNSPETIVYSKSHTLLGLDAAAVDRLRAGARPVLVEGAMDREAVRALGEDLVPLAPCGTAVTQAQLDLLRDLVPGGLESLLVALDGDSAGRKAAARVWNMLTPEEATSVEAAVVPGDADPADLIKAGRVDELRTVLEQPIPLTHVVVDGMLDAAPMEFVEQRVATVRAIAQTLATLPTANVAGASAYVAQRLGDALDPGTVVDAFISAHVAIQPPAPLVDAIDVDGDASSAAGVVAADVARVRAWASTQADLIAARVDALVTAAEISPPAWAATIAPVPQNPEEAERWRAAMRRIVAYRDRWSVASVEPVPEGPRHGEQGRARADAARALDQLVRQAPAPSTSDSIERARLRVQSAQRIDAARERTQASPERRTTADRLAALRRQREDATTDAERRAVQARIARLEEQRRREAGDSPRGGSHDHRGPQI